MTHADQTEFIQPDRALTVRIGAPSTPVACREDDPDGWFRIHPELTALPDGRLILNVSHDRDCLDAEYLVYESNDQGETWRPTLDWPSSDTYGEHLLTHHLALPDGTSLVVYALGVFATDEPGRYLLPTWQTASWNKDGNSWGDVQAATVTLPIGEAMDVYDADCPYRAEHPNPERGLKPEAPPALQALYQQFGRSRLLLVITDMLALTDQKLLAFAYCRAAGAKRHTTVCLVSADGGQSWQHLSTPGAWEDRFATENFLRHSADGLCEPSVTRLADGTLFLVMRLGSRHPLYACTSQDEGATWSAPRPLPVYGILPSVQTLDDGTLVLASGRPHVTLSISTDGGYRWPWSYRFLEDGKPEDPSTRNNTMLKIGPQRLLYMYDHGGYHEQLAEAFTGKRRIVAHTIDVTLS